MFILLVYTQVMQEILYLPLKPEVGAARGPETPSMSTEPIVEVWRRRRFEQLACRCCCKNAFCDGARDGVYALAAVRKQRAKELAGHGASPEGVCLACTVLGFFGCLDDLVWIFTTSSFII